MEGIHRKERDEGEDDGMGKQKKHTIIGFMRGVLW